MTWANLLKEFSNLREIKIQEYSLDFPDILYKNTPSVSHKRSISKYIGTNPIISMAT